MPTPMSAFEDLARCFGVQSITENNLIAFLMEDLPRRDPTLQQIALDYLLVREVDLPTHMLEAWHNYIKHRAECCADEICDQGSILEKLLGDK